MHTVSLRLFRRVQLTATAVAAALLLASLGVCEAAGWTPDLTVTNSFTEGNTEVIAIYTSGGGTYATGCAANSWIFAADTDARRSRAYATILTALTTGKKIRFWYSDTCAVWSYHQATSVMLVN